jgi:predicted adenine nucleotide alpha hydrolase (AANH) superfamily ATPase
VSPHKNSPLVFAAGRAAGGDHFLEENFKKKNGFLRSVQLAKEFGLYRQDYCGCEFSLASRGKTP